MLGLLRLWFSLEAPVSARAYALSGFELMAFKYAAEALTIHAVSGRWLTPLDYLNPLLSVRQAALAHADWLLGPLLLWSLPFLWIGVSMTMRRAEDSGQSGFAALLFFLPGVNYLLMLALCLAPSRPHTVSRAYDPKLQAHALRSALLGVALAVALALGMAGASVLVFRSYSTTLFLTTPFVMGATSAGVFNAGARRSLGLTLAVATLAVVLSGGALLLFAFEGLGCLMMAAPIAIAMAAMGAVIGRALAGRIPSRPVLAALVLPLPLVAGVETARPETPLTEVLTTIEVDAPPPVVWRHVVSFSELPEPPALVFRGGIAYPRRATIEGRGVGALRRCEFSTGAFLEPITAWEEPRRLAFDVAEQPAPMEEWSPYRHVLPPHLEGYVRSRRGEFRLLPLPGGRTRLEGRTFYTSRIFPTPYWNFWTDALIHAIHSRVLRHVKALAEADGAGA